ncbi:unnamed protein product [Menidia menidia]|uniref:(Atlantic silverside) hypothetical protein n=1 Tax=Menidia menidia TaxID=238744 RepID=A0A8S4BPR5_9TELE|nr:unnamed protein product [Menidia menidia]
MEVQGCTPAGTLAVNKLGSVSVVPARDSDSSNRTGHPARIVRSRQWCEMTPCMEGEVCSLLFNRSGWTCTRGSGRIKTVTQEMRRRTEQRRHLSLSTALGRCSKLDNLS